MFHSKNQGPDERHRAFQVESGTCRRGEVGQLSAVLDGARNTYDGKTKALITQVGQEGMDKSLGDLPEVRGHSCA